MGAATSDRVAGPHDFDLVANVRAWHTPVRGRD
jgi:hypothetical protein